MATRTKAAAQSASATPTARLTKHVFARSVGTHAQEPAVMKPSVSPPTTCLSALALLELPVMPSDNARYLLKRFRNKTIPTHATRRHVALILFAVFRTILLSANAFPDTLGRQLVPDAILNAQLTQTARATKHASTTSALTLVQVDVGTVLNVTLSIIVLSAPARHKWLAIRLLLADKRSPWIHVIRHHAVQTVSAGSATEQQCAHIQNVSPTMTARQTEPAIIRSAEILASMLVDLMRFAPA